MEGDGERREKRRKKEEKNRAKSIIKMGSQHNRNKIIHKTLYLCTQRDVAKEKRSFSDHWEGVKP